MYTLINKIHIFSYAYVYSLDVTIKIWSNQKPKLHHEARRYSEGIVFIWINKNNVAVDYTIDLIHLEIDLVIGG